MKGPGGAHTSQVIKRHHVVIGLVNEILLVPSEKQFIDSPTTLLTESTEALQPQSLSHKQHAKLYYNRNIISSKAKYIIAGHGSQLGYILLFLDATEGES